jgi:hypothetical protein
MVVNSAGQILITFSPFATRWNKGVYIARLPRAPNSALPTALLKTPRGTWGWLCVALLSVSSLFVGVLLFQGPNFLKSFFKLFVHSRHVLHSLGKRSLNFISVG